MKGRIGPGRTGVLVLTLLVLGTAVQAKTLSINAEGTGNYPTIRAAIDKAGNGDTIVLAPGLYVSFGNQDITMWNKVLTLRSQNPDDPNVVADTVIDCQGDAMAWSTHWAIGVQSTGAPARLMLQGLTIRNGWDVGDGCAIRSRDADLDVTNCIFRNNRTFDSQGGAVACVNSHARFTRCTFLNNACFKQGVPRVAEGGQLYPDLLHGGVLYADASQIEFTDCRFEATTGCTLETWDCQLTLTDCTFRNNQGQDGGAIRCRGDATPQTTSLALTRCLFAGNSSTTDGGALYFYKTATATITACTFSTNKADQGGGAIYNYGTSPTVVSCLFTGNAAVGNGGVIHSMAGGSPHFYNCTLVANTAGHGGAVAAQGGSSPQVRYSILWGNTAVQGNSVYLGTWPYFTPPTATVTVAFCDIQDGQGSTFTEAGCTLSWDSASNIDHDPLFVAPGTADYHLLPESPCVDAGDPAYVPGSGQTDLDGHARRAGPAVDLGAYELPPSYTLTVKHGSGSGRHPAGQVQAISADPAPAGKKFGWWIGNTQYVANVYQASTMVTMPAVNATVTATYMGQTPTGLLYDWNNDGIISIVGDMPAFVRCLYFGDYPEGVDPLVAGDGNHDGKLSIAGDAQGFVESVYFQKGRPQ